MSHRDGEFSLALRNLVMQPTTWLLLIIVAFAVFFGALAVQQHRVFLTHGLDIGNVDQALWNTAQGNFLQFTLMAPVTSRLALHVEPILLAFVPFYWFRAGGPELLLVVQVLVVALGAWPLYQIAVSKFQLAESDLMSRWTLLIIPLAYLLLPTLESAVLYDFHAVTMAPTFLLLAFLAIERNRTSHIFLFLFLAMATKEDMPLVVAMMGVYVGLVSKRWRLAGAIIMLSAIWFLVAVLLIQPLGDGGGNIQLDRYAWLGDSLLEMMLTALTNPGAVLNHLWFEADLPDYLFFLFFPTAYLALFNPLTLLPMLPTLAVNLLSDNPFTWRLEDFHYGAPLAPFLFISAIYGIQRISRWKRRASDPARRPSRGFVLVSLLLLLLTFTLVYHYHRGYTSLSRSFRWPAYTDHHSTLDAMIATIPPDSVLFAQSNLAPHLSQREVIYSDFAYFTDPNFPAAAPVQDVLLDITTLENFGGLHQYLQQILQQSGDFTLVAAQDGILHYKADGTMSQARNDDLPDSFYTFSVPENTLEYSLPASFGDEIRLVGYALHFDRQEEVEVTIDLMPLKSTSDVQPVLYLLDADGRPLGATVDLQPALVWQPVETWSVDQPVRLRFNTLPWYTRDMAEYRLALGLVRGGDPWLVEKRLPIGVESGVVPAVRLPADGTLLELAHITQVWWMPGGGPQMRLFDRPGVPVSISANFDQQLELFGYSRPVVESRANEDSLTITLYWQALSPPESLIRFVQLVGPDGRVYGQQDTAPVDNQYPTELWQPGEVVVDTVTLLLQPLEEEGQYTLHIGFYRPDALERLLLSSGADHVEIAVP